MHITQTSCSLIPASLDTLSKSNQKSVYFSKWCLQIFPTSCHSLPWDFPSLFQDTVFHKHWRMLATASTYKVECIAFKLAGLLVHALLAFWYFWLLHKDTGQLCFLLWVIIQEWDLNRRGKKMEKKKNQKQNKKPPAKSSMCFFKQNLRIFCFWIASPGKSKLFNFFTLQLGWAERLCYNTALTLFSYSEVDIVHVFISSRVAQWYILWVHKCTPLFINKDTINI